MKLQKLSVIEEAFGQIYGKPCWNVKQGFGSFLTFEFGNPHLEIREPDPNPHTVSPKLRWLHSRRRVTIHGDWYLWIYCCRWKLWEGKKLICHSESTRRIIEKALRNLDGQALQTVRVNPKNSLSEFGFDLGGRLETKRFNRKSEQWLLYEPNGKVLTLRADTKYLHDFAEKRDEASDWQVLK